MQVKRLAGSWWVLKHLPAVGPYETRQEAVASRDGLRKFYGRKTLPRSHFLQGAAITMKVSRESLVSMLVEVGFETADKWPDSRLKSKLQKLPALNDGDEPLEAQTKEGTKLLSAVLAAVENKEEIEFEDAASEEADEKPTRKPKEAKAEKATETKAEKPAKAAKPAKEKAEKPAKAAKTEKSENPALREGGKPALLVGQLTKKPRELDEIIAGAGLTKAQTGGYMAYLVKKGFAIKTDDGKYSLPEA